MFAKLLRIKLVALIALCLIYIFCIIITKMDMLDGIFLLIMMPVFFYIYLSSFLKAVYQKSIPVLNIVFCLFLIIGSPILFMLAIVAGGQGHFNNDNVSFLMLSVIFVFILGILGLFVPTIIRYILYKKEKKMVSKEIEKNIVI